MLHSGTEEANELPPLPSENPPGVLPAQTNSIVEALKALGRALAPAPTNLTEGTGAKPAHTEFKRRSRGSASDKRRKTKPQRRTLREPRPRVKGKPGGNAKP